ncbi:(2Fe-2S) ferredoxin domain-containing protein [Geitlerinema sp. PCC 7407]|uniref:(2Fe-2S) ferredoxin domain-containing protein n=1 Tax=Geitlerinema sp. PCC 7407 TaxID=1173025 RepID=UPI00029FFA85|nr:(2Fe-2S) ferredoxin domain-containing protein [Geitlerinema sp. PCC 7407]AFY65880.1 hypothetical protein GEI7407_1386 [Geitlerinema sp. PCC 7407]
MAKSKYVSEFALSGRLVAFLVGDQPKYLRLQTADSELLIKIPKEDRFRLPEVLSLGVWVHVEGERKVDFKKGLVKHKAHTIVPTSVEQTGGATSPAAAQPPAPATAKPACILVCRKSDCWKRGGREVSAALQTNLRDRGLDEQVTIKETGCMKRCKAGPNIVMPDKTRYSRISASEVPQILDRHCETASPAAPAPDRRPSTAPAKLAPVAQYCLLRS